MGEHDGALARHEAAMEILHSVLPPDYADVAVTLSDETRRCMSLLKRLSNPPSKFSHE